jgi:hypothetical protein
MNNKKFFSIFSAKRGIQFFSKHCKKQTEMLNQYSGELHNCSENDLTGVELLNFLPRTTFLAILQKKVEKVSHIPIAFVDKVWTYIEGVVISVLMHHSENYHQLQLSTRGAGHNLIARMKEHSRNWVTEIVQMEKLTDYTSNPEYMNDWNKLMAQQHDFVRIYENLPESEDWNKCCCDLVFYITVLKQILQLDFLIFC